MFFKLVEILVGRNIPSKFELPSFNNLLRRALKRLWGKTIIEEDHDFIHCPLETNIDRIQKDKGDNYAHFVTDRSSENSKCTVTCFEVFPEV